MPTSSGGIRYPAASDSVNIPGDMQKIAEDVDTYKAPKASPTFTGVASFPDGSASAPSITNTGDANTGILFPAADTVAISTGGSERLRVDSNGLITGTGTSLGAWTAYTPTLGGTGWALGNGSASGRYAQIGKVVYFSGVITFGSTSTFGGSALTISLPATRANASPAPAIRVRLSDVSAGKVYLGAAAILASATTFTPQSQVASTTGELASLTTSAPFTWEDTDQIIFSGTYEAA